MKCFYVNRACLVLRKGFQRQAGFTLIEAVLVLAMIGILAGITVPAVLHWLPDYRLRRAAMAVCSDMQQARLEAIKSDADIIVVFTPGIYMPSGNVGSYKIFVDDGSGGGTAGDGVQNGGERLLRQVNMPRNVSLYSDNFTSHTTGYNNRGFPWNNRWGNIRLRNNNSRYYQILFSMAGNISLQKSNDGITWW